MAFGLLSIEQDLLLGFNAGQRLTLGNFQLIQLLCAGNQFRILITALGSVPGR